MLTGEKPTSFLNFASWTPRTDAWVGGLMFLHVFSLFKKTTVLTSIFLHYDFFFTISALVLDEHFFLILGKFFGGKKGYLIAFAQHQFPPRGLFGTGIWLKKLRARFWGPGVSKRQREIF